MDWMYRDVYPKIRRYILSNNGTADDSKDVFQEALLVFYRQVIEHKFDQIRDIEGYIIGVSRNIWINRARKRSREVDMVDSPTDTQDDPLIHLIMTEKWDAFQRLFERIGEKCRELLTYAAYEKLSMEEIAVKMQFTNANAAKTTHYRCKQKLIDLVTADQELANSLRA